MPRFTHNRIDLKMASRAFNLNPSSSSFTQLAEDKQFVDKSLTLQDFLNYRTPIHLLLRPRRSGKTTLLTMFR